MEQDTYMPSVFVNTGNNTDGFSAMKAAYINLQTEIVENIIMITSVDESVPEGYKLVTIPIKNADSEENLALINILKDIDPNYQVPSTYTERQIVIGTTKWNESKGFYDDGVQF